VRKRYRGVWPRGSTHVQTRRRKFIYNLWFPLALSQFHNTNWSLSKSSLINRRTCFPHGTMTPLTLLLACHLLAGTNAIKNPIISGWVYAQVYSNHSWTDRRWNPDPSILRVGNEYFIATSSFEYFPGIPIYKSKDLANWELYSHALTTPEHVQLYGVPTGAGILHEAWPGMQADFKQVCGLHLSATSMADIILHLWRAGLTILLQGSGPESTFPHLQIW
jgi:hypothetical protein